jgi:hypothetical protein
VLEARRDVSQELCRVLARRQAAGQLIASAEIDKSVSPNRVSAWFSDRLHVCSISRKPTEQTARPLGCALAPAGRVKPVRLGLQSFAFARAGDYRSFGKEAIGYWTGDS